uniref:Uncharacterized protein n=1 Tax=Arundo donax TaxID=35708 RepID=A0A0A8ZBT6_ARUDO
MYLHFTVTSFSNILMIRI